MNLSSMRTWLAVSPCRRISCPARRALPPGTSRGARMANQSADRTGDECMQLLELFPTIVGVFEYYGFDRDAPAWRASVVEELTERERKLGAPQGQTDDRLHERPELANLIA